jgi:dTDP-4-dehydrorhamnose 3,5-epimerase
MEFVKTPLEGVLVIEPDVHRDARGFFLETYNEERYARGGLAVRFVQDNHSRSTRGTLRGLHAQLRKPQGKLVRAVEGEIFDVAVDVRRGSPHFGEWFGVVLSAESFRQLYVPPGFVHGFCVLSDLAQVEYKCTEFYDPGGEVSVLWNDPDIGIDWPLEDEPRLSPKDAAAARLRDVADLPDYGAPRP